MAEKKAIVFDRTEDIQLDKAIAGITKLRLKHIAPQDGKTGPVTHQVTAFVKSDAGEIIAGRDFQVMFRLRAPQVKDENTGKWSDDPNFPEKLREAETLKAISAVLAEHIAK